MTMFKTWSRHIIAWIMAGIGGWITAGLLWLGTDAEGIEQVLSSVELILTVVITGIFYAVVEKGLKPFWTKTLGERQTDDDISTTLRSLIFMCLMIPASFALIGCSGDSSEAADHRGGNSAVEQDSISKPGEQF